jgi:lysophospholipase L1-like esterase
VVRLAAVHVTLAIIAAACTGSPGAPSAAPFTPGTNPTPAAATSTPAAPSATVAQSAPPTPAPTPTEITGPHLTLVGLGDSVPGGLKCTDPCRSYVLTAGDLAATALGQPVATINLATNDGLQSDTLLHRVTTDDAYRTAIASADIVTLQVGWNDWQGPCNFDNHESCLEAGQKRVEPNVDGILEEIQALRAGKPTAVRVVTYYNGYLGNRYAPAIWSMPASPENVALFDKDFREALIAFNEMLCGLAEQHDAVCVDVGPAFNGKDLDQPAAEGLINSDGIHGLAAGHDLIAKLLTEAGFAEIE